MATQREYVNDDVALLKACQKGDHAAYECLVLRHQRMLLDMLQNHGVGFGQAIKISNE